MKAISKTLLEPKKRARSRIQRKALAAIFLSISMIATQGCDNDCTSRSIQHAQSDSGAVKVDVVYRACAGGAGSGSDTYTIRLNVGSRCSDSMVLETQSDAAPTLLSVDNQRASVMLNSYTSVPKIAVSLICGITVNYFRRQSMTAEVFDKDLNSYRERASKDIDAAKTTFSGGSKEGELEILRKSTDDQAKSFSLFDKWAKEHNLQTR